MRSHREVCRLAFVLFVVAACTHALAAAPLPAIGNLFGPDRVKDATLSPDGQLLAYVVHEGPVASVIIRSVDAPANQLTVFADVGQRRRGSGRSSLAPARVLFVGWADSATLVYAVALPTERAPLNEEVHVVDATGGNDHVVLTSNDIETAFLPPIRGGGSPNHNVDVDGSADRGDKPDEFPDSVVVARALRVIGFDPTRPGTVLVEAMGSQLVPSDSYRIDLKSGHRDRLAESPGADRVLYDINGMPRIRETPRLVMPPLGGTGIRIRMPLPIPPTRTPPQTMRQRFEYHGPGPHGFWHPLNQLVGDRAMPGFTVADTDYYEPRSFPLGFADDPNVVYIASNVGRDTYGLYALDLTKGTRMTVLEERDGIDLVDPAQAMTSGPLVLDRSHHLVGVRVPGVFGTTHWFDPVLARLQQTAEARFTHRTVTFLDWNDAKTRVLMLASGPSDRSRIFIFDDGSPPEFREFLRVAAPPPRPPTRFSFRRPTVLPLPEPAHVEPFTFTTDHGVTLHGIVTLARQPRLNPPPLVIICPDVPQNWLLRDGFDAEAQAFARSGYLTVEVAYRGTAGFGLRHRDAIKAGYDRVPLEDIQATLRWLAPRYPYDRRRIALVGHGFGAYVALRALELAPAEFRAAAAIDVLPDLPQWVEADDLTRGGPSTQSESNARRRAFFHAPRNELEAISLERGIRNLRRPVLLMTDLSRGPSVAASVRDFATRLAKLGVEAEYVAGAGNLRQGKPAAPAILRTVEFLNANVYDYRVDVGQEHEVK